MRGLWFALVLAACSGGADPAATPALARPTADGSGAAMSGGPGDGARAGGTVAGGTANQGSQAMSQDPKQPGGTGVDEHGVLLRSKPDPSAPKADPAMVADDAANLLFYAGALVGDPALQRRTWQQLGLADAAGAPTPRMTDFIRAHQEWVRVKADVAASVATPAKARAYLDAHLKP